MAYSTTAETIEALASNIGDKIYIDIANWHLFMREAHLHTLLAERLFHLISNDEINDVSVHKVLAEVQVKIGGGKRELVLTDLIPTAGVADLVDLLEEFRRNL
ncbi:MAG: DUF3181 family protein [Elainellaceae cyanobacterium]